MILAEAREKCKAFLKRVPRDVFIVAIVALASSLSFGLGFLAGKDAGRGGEAVPLEASPLAAVPSDEPATKAEPAAGRVVASKNGTKYYLPDCASAGRISDANKVWFVSAAAARKAGYEPATNCKGL